MRTSTVSKNQNSTAPLPSSLEAYTHLDTTFTEHVFLRDFINRLTHTSYRGLLLYKPWLSCGSGAEGTRPKVPDFVLPKLGIVIEIDGEGAHDRNTGSIRRDQTREYAYSTLGYTVMRFTDTQIRSDHGRARAIDDVMQLIRTVEAHEDRARLSGSIRQRVSRFQKKAGKTPKCGPYNNSVSVIPALELGKLCYRYLGGLAFKFSPRN